MKIKRFLVFLITIVLIFGTMPIMAMAENDSRGFSDMPNDWSTAALQHAVDNGLLVGANGKLNPKGDLTRAEMATIITRAFNAQVKKSVAAFPDVKTSEWYADYLAKAYQMQIMQGSNGLMLPKASITRQEAFVIIARALKLTPAETMDKNFSDANKIASWAKQEVAALVNAGYIQGSAGLLNPTGNITRAEFTQVMKNVIEHYINQAGTYTDTYSGNVMVNVADVTLQGSTVTGDLIIGDGVGNGDITLDGVKVTGRVLVRGGGANSIHVVGDSQISSMVISRVDGEVRVVCADGVKIDVVLIEDGSDDVILEGNFGTVTVVGEGIKVVTSNATIQNLVVQSETATVVTKPSTPAETDPGGEDPGGTTPPTPTVAAVSISTNPANTSGLANDAGAVTVTLTTTTDGAEIRYTTDGSAPTAASALYTAPFTLSNTGGYDGETFVVKAIAIKAGMNSSAVASHSIVYSATTTATVATANEFKVALEHNNIETINLGADINGAVTAVRTGNKSFTINFGAYILTGNLNITADNVSSISFTGTANPSLVGDLTVTAGMATVYNGIAISGAVVVADVGSSSWIEQADGNRITLTDSNGATIVIEGNPEDITVTETADGGINITANSPVSITVEAGAHVASITATGDAAGTTITNNGTLESVTAETDIAIENNSGTIAVEGSGTVGASGTAAGNVTGETVVTGLTGLAYNPDELRIGRTLHAIITYVPDKGTGSYNVTSANTDVVSVDSATGLTITAVKSGRTAITVQIKDAGGTVTHQGTVFVNVLPAVITSASVTVEAPVLGANPQVTAATETATHNEDYTVTNVVWNEDLTASGTFKASTTYTATITLVSKNGKAFQEGAFTPTVSGSTSVGTTTTVGASVGNRVTFTVTFPVTANLAVSTVSFADAGPIYKSVVDADFANAATGTGDGAITYVSTNTAVATVNTSTGVVTIVGVGSTVITATQAESDLYAEGTVTYTLYVTEPGEDPPIFNTTQSIGYDSIQDAVNAADTNDTITLGACEFIESGQIVIDKNLTIIGSNKDTTIIKPAQNTEDSGDNRGWILVESGVEFNLSKVTLDGEGKDIYQAIRSYGSGTIENSIIKNIKWTTNQGAGLVFVGVAEDFVVSGNIFENIDRNAIVVYGTGITGGTINDNEFIGRDSDTDLEYGVEVSEGATNVMIEDNEFSNYGKGTTNYSSAAISIVSRHDTVPTGATITGNILEDNYIGLAIGNYYDKQIPQVTVDNNQFKDNTYHVFDDRTNYDNDPENLLGTILSNNEFTPKSGIGDGVIRAVKDNEVSNQDSGKLYSTIQSAIDGAVAGNTILVWPGEYDVVILGQDGKLKNYLWIDKSITIKAADMNNKPILKAKWETGYGKGNHQQATVHITADNVTLDGLVINAIEDYGGWSKVVEITGANYSTVKNCEIKSITNDDTSIYLAGTTVGQYTIVDNELEGGIVPANGAGNGADGDKSIIRSNTIGGSISFTGKTNSGWDPNSFEVYPTIYDNYINGLGAMLINSRDEDPDKLISDVTMQAIIDNNDFPEGLIVVAEDVYEYYGANLHRKRLMLDPAVYNETTKTVYETLEAAFDAASVDDTIVLGKNFVLTDTLTLDKSITLDLNGKKLSTPDVTGAAAKTVIEITGTSNVVIKGEGLVQSGTTTDFGSISFMDSAAVKLQSNATLTVKDGAVIKGGDAINTNESGRAIVYWTSGNLTIDNATIIGGNNIKDSDKANENSHKYQGTAGDGIYVFNGTGTINITNGSLVQGGNGVNNGYDAAYIDGGLNQAGGGHAVYGQGQTYNCTISDSIVKGGDSDIYNAGTAINVGKGTFTVTSSTVEGGNSYAIDSGNYGIGGTAIALGKNSNVGSVTIQSSIITGGDGGDSWLGFGIEYGPVSSTLNIDNSIISGGGVNGIGSEHGYALNLCSGAVSSFTNVELQNTLFRLGTDPTKVAGGLAIYKVGGGLEELLNELVGSENYNINEADGSVLIGSQPTIVTP